MPDSFLNLTLPLPKSETYIHLVKQTSDWKGEMPPFQNPSIPFSSQRVVGISSSFLSSPTAWPRNAGMLSPPSVTCGLVVGVFPWQLGNVGLNLPGRGKPRTRLAFLRQVVLTTGLWYKWWEAPLFPLETASFDGSKTKLAVLSALKTCSGEAWGLLVATTLSCSTYSGTFALCFLSWPLTAQCEALACLF